LGNCDQKLACRVQRVSDERICRARRSDFSISKALNPGEKMFFVQDEQDIKPSLTKEAKRIYKSHCSSIRTSIDLRMIGFICHVFAPTWVRANSRLVAASQFDIFLTDSLRSVLPVSTDALKGLLARI
jgi:hypothetical protein